MESHEVLQDAFEKGNPKEIAAALGVSLSLVYKWAQPPSEEGAGSGSRNPLDRVASLLELTRDPRILQWLCHCGDGYFVRNPPSMCKEDFEVMPATNEIVAQFARLLSVISKAALDNVITEEESEEIRQVWDTLKCYGEGFVRCCEEGDFASLEPLLKR